jgi:hypothetical protein
MLRKLWADSAVSPSITCLPQKIRSRQHPHVFKLLGDAGQHIAGGESVGAREGLVGDKISLIGADRKAGLESFLSRSGP